ncbi:MAG: hypothetical protein A2V62_03355 [Nitrospirae bacterium RBG_19FT_COMBO_58_9]|nr:MAG: hypothetical protein A2V62_03355 [Nitrospirae bacterium RBG_19FT_COMBO_58_9]
MALTNFQRDALHEVQNLFASTPNLELSSFQEVVGKKETYLKATVKAAQHILEVYLYEDEAGYLLEGGEWTIFEKPDYSTSSELLGAFLASLNDKLS